MANDFDNPGGPLIVDTGGAGATGTVTASKICLRRVRLVPAAAASLATLTDTAGNVVAAMAAAANGTSDTLDFGPDGQWVTGLKVPTLSGSGAKLYIWTK